MSNYPPNYLLAINLLKTKNIFRGQSHFVSSSAKQNNDKNKVKRQQDNKVSQKNAFLQ